MSNQQSQATPGVAGHGKYGAFQTEIYAAGMMYGILPSVTTDPNKLEEQARGKLTPLTFNYVAGGAGERATMDANRLAFRQWKMVPRMLRPTANRDLSIELFGQKYGQYKIAMGFHKC